MSNSFDIEQLYIRQLPIWETARHNYRQLNNIEVRNMAIEGVTIRIQHNPARIKSVSAKVDKPQECHCFLCQENLPAEQMRLACLNDEFQVLVNPFPIFHHHFTIPAVKHTPQRIADRFTAMLQLTHDCTPYTIFYNGARCGASAPMHLHFQAAQAGCMPIEQQWKCAQQTVVCQHQTGELSSLNNLLRPVFLITATKATDAQHLFEKLYKVLPPIDNEEPMMNILARHEDNKYIIMIFPRAKHRPDCYYAEGKEQRLISPGTVEMGGLFITPRKNDFEQLTEKEIIDIYTEVSTSPDEIEKIIVKLQKSI